MRRLGLPLALLCALVACKSLDNPSSAGGDIAECTGDSDCVAAAATCCDCPSFAVGFSEPTHKACSDVMCPVTTTCPDNVHPACADHACTLVCSQLVCATPCAAGYAMDPDGCLSCACAQPAPGGCMGDTDCVRVPADCCGCDHGGADTAVLASQAGPYGAGLDCPPDPQCPSVDTCDPDEAPHCHAGHCELTTMSGIPPNACGRSDLPACPPDTVCVINHDNSADLEGVGVCTSP